MQQAWHIFLKDVRRLRYELIVVLALTAAYAWLQGHWSPLSSARNGRLNQTAGLLRDFLLPVAWWFLASMAVYGEPLPGDRQFWVTRPYRWTSLLGAKLLFIVAFVSLPLLLADCVILTLQGFHAWANPGGLLLHEVEVFAVLLLPMIALACITTSFAQVVLVVLSTIVSIVVLGIVLSPVGDGVMIGFGVAGEWIEGSLVCLVLLCATLAVIILQYRARRTWVARAIFVATVLLLLYGGRLLPWRTGLALESRLLQSRNDTSSITAVFAPGGSPPLAVSPVREGIVRVSLPVRLDGVPPGTTAVVDEMWGELIPPDGKPLEMLLSFGESLPDMVWHDTVVERRVFERWKSTTVRLHLTIHLTMLGNPHTEDVPLAGGPYRVLGVGLCEFDPRPPDRSAISCRAPFRQPAYVLTQFDKYDKDVPKAQQRTDYSPYPAEFGISPISDYSWSVPTGATTVTFTTMKPLAHIRRELDIPNVRLADFAY
jgi:hypothetical protein